MTLSTPRLFTALLRPLQVDVVCDIGSLNGADALRFRRALPDAAIVAFEANPQNYRNMLASPALQRARIEVLPCAVAEQDGAADFYVVPLLPGSESLARRGMSSLYQRADADKRGSVQRVATRRLDRVLTERGVSGRIALWIDAEGAAFEVLEGARGVLDRVALVHVEVETTPCIGAAQKLYPEVAALLRARGFVEIARDSPVHHAQFNALFLRGGLAPAQRAAVWIHRWRQQLRRWMVNILLASFPARLKRYLLIRRQLPAALPDER